MNRLSEKLREVIYENIGSLNSIEEEAIKRSLVRFAAYEDIEMEPEEITANMEMFAAYRHVCGGLPPEKVEEALRRTAEDDKAREEGRLVELPCKPNETFLHRNYDTGALELNIALHDFDGKTSELPWEEIDLCAYWE